MFQNNILVARRTWRWRTRALRASVVRAECRHPACSDPHVIGMPAPRPFAHGYVSAAAGGRPAAGPFEALPE